MAAAQEVATTMLSGAEDDEALQLIAQRAAEVAEAALAALILPGWGGEWMLELAVGEGSEGLVGTVMPHEGRAASVIRAGLGLVVADLASDPQLRVDRLREYGPALYAPLLARGERVGVLMVARRIGERPFTEADLTTAQTFAGQAALALQLADGRRRSEEAELLEDRARIARDLHDLVVQELFAMGMRLTRLRTRIEPEALTDIDSSLDSLDRVVRQIRSTIRALRDPDDVASLTDRVHAEAARAYSFLGFTPAVVIEVPEELDPDDVVSGEIADDLIAVVREGLSNAARHARASAVTVHLEVSPARVRVEVRDDGVGLPHRLTRRSGLDNLAERARRHGGTGIAVPGPGGGASLRWQVPLR
jgi:signal transduction histidine kinase